MLCFGIFGAEHYHAVLYTQAVIDLLACILLADLARRLFGSRAALPALWLATLCPFTASYTAAALTETLTGLTIILAFYALVRWPSSTTSSNSSATSSNSSPSASPWNPWNRWLWILSAALAGSILLRPDQGLLAAATIPALLFLRLPSTSARRRTRTRLLAAVSLCTLLPLLPWTLRNARTFHVFEPLAPRSAVDPGDPVPIGFYRWYRTWGLDFASTEDVYWNYDGAPIAFADLPSRAFDSPAQLRSTAALLHDYDRTSQPTPELDARFSALAAQRIHAHPLRYYVLLPIGRLVNMLLRPRIEMLPIPLSWWRWHEHPGQTAFSLAYAALNLAYLVLGALGLLRWLRRPGAPSKPVAWSMLAYILLRSALLLTLDNSEPRYTLELFPILMVCAASLFARTPRTSQPISAGRRSSSYPS